MKYLLLLFLVCTLGYANTCVLKLKSAAQPGKTVSLDKKTTKNVYYAQDPCNDEFYIRATLSSEGELQFNIQKEDKERELKAEWKGSEAFDNMMAHFKGRVKRVRCHWYRGSNFETFNSELEKGASREEAALATWSAKQLGRYGFTKIEGPIYQTRNGVYAIFVKP